MADSRKARMLKGIQDAYIAHTDGTGTGLDEEAKKALRDYAGKAPASPAITGRPDPEQEVETQFWEAVNARKPVAGGEPSANPQLPPGMTMDQARKTINPRTGLPYSVSEPEIAGDTPEDKADREMRMRVLQSLKNQ